MKHFPFLFALCFAVFAVAQEKIPNNDYEVLYEQIVKSSQKGDFEETLEYISPII